MTDVTSRVGVEFTADGADKVVRSLAEVTATGAKTEVALNAVAEAERRVAQEAQRAASQSKALSNTALNLGRQFSDVGVSIAGGISPLMVLIQQGPQIADAFQVAKQQGLGFSAVLTGLRVQATAALAALAPFAPAIAAVAGVAALAGAAIYSLTKSYNETKVANEKLTKQIHDFHDQLVKSVPSLDQNAQAANFAAEGAKNFEAYLQKGIVALADYGEKLKTATINQYLLEAAQARTAARQLREKNTFVNSRGITVYSGLDGTPGVARYKALQQEADAEVQLAEARALAAIKAPTSAFQKEQAEGHKRVAAAVKTEAEEVGKAAGLWDQLAADVAKYASAADPTLKQTQAQAEISKALAAAAEAAILGDDDAAAAARRRAESLILLEQVQTDLKRSNVDFGKSTQVVANDLKDATDNAKELARAFRDVQGALSYIGKDFKSGNLGALLLDVDSLVSGVQALGANGLSGALSIGSSIANAIGGKTGRTVGTSLGIASSGIGLGAFAASTAGAAALGAAGLSASAIATLGAVAPPLAVAAAALYAAAKLFNVGGKPTNAGAGFDLVTGALSGGKRTSETEQAATTAGQAIAGIQDALKAAGIALKDTVTGLVIGTRDETQIYLSSGQTLRSAVGDSGAAVDAAFSALLAGATYVSDAQKNLVESAVAAGKGFDAVSEILSKYEAAQGITKSLADQIQQLQDPKAFDLAGVEKNIASQRDAAKQLAADGYITADTLATINGQLNTLRGLQVDKVLKRYAGAVVDATEAARQAANDNLSTANDNLSTAQQDLIDAYGRQADALKATADRFRSLADSLRAFRDTLTGSSSLSGQYSAARAAFQRTSGLAEGGDAKALADLPGVAQAYLSAARAVAPDARAYARDLAAVRNAVEASANVADQAATAAEAQLQALHDQVAVLVSIDTHIQTVGEAIVALATAVAAQANAQAAVDAFLATAPAATVSAPSNAPLSVDTTALEAKVVALTDEVANLRAEQAASQAEIAKTNTTTANILTRVTLDGESLQTTVAA